MSRKHCNWMSGSGLLAGVLLVISAVGCESPQEVIDSIVWRQRAMVEKLPAAERERMITPAQPVTTTASAELPAGPILSLDDARRIALQTNPDIHGARARLEAALARIDEARSFFAPQLGLLHNSTRTLHVPAQRTRITSPISPVSDLPPLNDLSLADLLGLVVQRSLGQSTGFSGGDSNSFSDHSTNLSATWTIFDGLVREARLSGSRHSFLASAMSLADAQRLLVHAVDTAYYQIQLSTERLRIARADEAFSRRQPEDARRRFDAGKITQGDVLNFEVRVRAGEANVVAAAGVRDTGRVLLAELLALPQAQLPDEVDVAPLQAETETDLTPPSADEWIERAFAQRPDLAQADHQLSASDANVKIARGQFSPELTLNGTWGYESLHDAKYSQEDQASGVAFELRWQLYTGGFRTSQLRRARANWWETAAQLESKRLEISAEVRRAIVDLKNAQEQVRLQYAKLDSAKENRRIVEEEHDAGKASLVRLNEAQRDYVQADAQHATARIQLRQSWTDLNAAASTYRVGVSQESATTP